MIDAKIIEWSINPDGEQLLTAELTYPRWLHGEIMTYRRWSRSSGSSRAISIEKSLKQVTEEPALPIFFGCEQPGMQAGNELSGADLWEAEKLIDKIHESVTSLMQEYIDLHPDKSKRLHKSVLNRYLEPFMLHKVIVTANVEAWEHMFSQRIHPDADRHFDLLAKILKFEMEISSPNKLDWGQWHLPYVTEEEKANSKLSIYDLVQISTARSARVSYLTHDGEKDVEKDFALYHKLYVAEPKHYAPMEHPAKAMKDWGVNHNKQGNFVGFQQHRWEIEYCHN